MRKPADGVLIMNLKGEILSLNESFAQMHGYTIKEMENMSIKQIDTPETYNFAFERLKKIINGETLQFEVNHYHKDGKIVTQEVNAKPCYCPF